MALVGRVVAEGPDHVTPAVTGAGFAFVGRQRESALLLAALKHPPAVVMVEGEAGVGKSRLVDEVTAGLTAQGGRVLTGCCHPLRDPFPYGSVIDALRQAGPWMPPVPEMTPLAGALAPLLPELADRLPPVPDDAQKTRAERYQLVQAVRAVLEACGPVTLVIEDLHWADEATRELLLLLARDLPSELSLVCTYRREDLPPNTPVLGAAYRRQPGTGGAEIHLDPLTEPDVHALAASALGRRATHALGRVLFERSAGLPLVVEEDLITLGDQTYAGQTEYLGGEAVGPPELGQGVVPRGLREAVAARVRDLSAEALEVVESAAVLAVPADEPLLAHVAGLEPEQGTEALVEALQAAVLRESQPMSYGFRHMLAQQAVYQSILGPRRRRLHERAVEALRTLDSPPLVRIAHHLHALGDRMGWLTQAEAAATQSFALGDQGTAATIIHQILAEPGVDNDVRTRAALGLSRIATFSVDYTASVKALRQILADPQLPVATRGEIRVGLGVILLAQAGDSVAGIPELERAVEELGEQPPEAAARAMSTLAIYTTYSGRPAAEAQAWIERAERTVEASPDHAARATVQANKIAVMTQFGDPRVWELVDRLPRAGESRPVLRQTVRALYHVAVAALIVGHDSKVGGLLNECEDLARRLDNPVMVGRCRSMRVGLAWYAGDWGDLEATYTSLSAEFPDLRVLDINGTLTLGSLAEARGQWAQALEIFSAATDASDFAVVAYKATGGIAQIRLLQGDPAAAWATTVPAMERLRRDGAWLRSSDLVTSAVQAALATGRPEAATQITTDLEHGIEGRDAPVAAASLQLCRGLLLRDSDPAQAREHFDRARAMFQGIGRPYPAADAAEHAARTLIPTTPHDAARDLTQIADTYARLGATHAAARCQQTLRDLGQTRPSTGRRGYGKQLSPREREVADLLAAGASNRDIAQVLFLSPRTAEHHVARVLKKLNVTDRNAVREALTTHSP